ncbi:hypothetical protein K2173_020358 [Erythroxylum novogranatense]|uniref:CG-1 domain-containing protein n=1 Tax=Erythroxylum novogranatense TaxID=1862640 RepID=A0AAV8UB11_9ROSI|nr:hypothetical protein K2173_020358 [Erythroxylum novogranatense]
MADRGSYGLSPRLDIDQLFIEAQHRWLRPAEICEILRNYPKFHISSEPPNRPPSGSLFLFDRKVLRYFRKDGHNWRKKKDGKTVKEAHEKLKVGSIDVLHCYYAHGEENENFQRRSYWMLEEELMHIVFVHYLEIKGSRTSNSPSNSSATNHIKEPSGKTDSTSPTSTLSSSCEDNDSADSHQVNSRYYFPESPQMQNSSMVGKINGGLWSSHLPYPGSENREVQSSNSGVAPISVLHGDRLVNNDNANHNIDSQSLRSWEEILQQCTTGYGNLASPVSAASSSQAGNIGIGGNMTTGEVLFPGSATRDRFDGSLPLQSNWQGYMNPTLDSDLGYDLSTSLYEQKTADGNIPNALEIFFDGPVQQNEQLMQNNLQVQHADEQQHAAPFNSENNISVEGNNKYSFILKQTFLDGEEGLKKVDSFSRWIAKELEEVDDLNMRPSSTISWSADECGNVVDDASLSPSLSQDQLFSIVDFAPKWGYTDSETEVHVIGTFLKSPQDVMRCKWSCMFGEIEVPAEILADGILCCYSPVHDVARVPFYVTCSNRLACSEVRDFDFRVGSAKRLDITDVYGGDATATHLHLRLERLMLLRSSNPQDHLFDSDREKKKLVSKIMLLKEEDENYQMTEPISCKDLSQVDAQKKMLQKLIKEKLYSWLLHKVIESGKRASVLDDDGQGVLHLAAALGYDWAIKPTLAAGVNINFRDANGWTALHWAAFFGREETVAVLVALGAASGPLTDPTPDCPLSRTPADLASANGHKGISGFLAESSLTSYLSSLTVKDPKDDETPEASGTSVVQSSSKRTATPLNHGDVPDELSLKDSLTAVRNATQAANRIYQMFRMKSFQQKQLADDEFDVSDEHALSVVAAKARKPLHSGGLAHAAATQIQKKYRGWKKRKEFLIIRQRIVKIQAHVRGHQVRKQYKTFVWSVGILEKVILRWRRRGSGLRGFRRDALAMDSNPQSLSTKENEYDFLQEGRKQSEQRTQKALNRVVSMFHHPDGRAQYRRLLTVAEKFRESESSDVVDNPEEPADGDEELIDIDSLLDDDTFMSIAFDEQQGMLSPALDKFS